MATTTVKRSAWSKALDKTCNYLTGDPSKEELSEEETEARVQSFFHRVEASRKYDSPLSEEDQHLVDRLHDLAERVRQRHAAESTIETPLTTSPPPPTPT